MVRCVLFKLNMKSTERIYLKKYTSYLYAPSNKRGCTVSYFLTAGWTPIFN